MPFKVNMRSGVPAAGDWINLLITDTAPVALDGSWSINYVSGSAPANEASSLGGWPTADDALWVDDENAATSGHRVPSAPAWVQLLVTGPANNSFDLKAYSNGPSGRNVEWRVNGGTSVILAEGVANSVANFSATTDGSGEALIEYREGAGSSGTGYANAIEITPGAASDNTAPTIDSASVPTAGDTIAVQISESMQVGAGGASGWSISLGDATISSAAVDGTDDTIINLTPSRTLTSSDSFTIGYTQPGDGFQDQAATPNDLATLSGQAVTNNSSQVAQVPGISAQTIRDKAGDLTPNATNLKIAVRESSDPESTVHYSTTTGSLNGSSQTAAINLASAGVTVGDTVHFSYFNPALNEGLNVDLTAEDIA